MCLLCYSLSPSPSLFLVVAVDPHQPLALPNSGVCQSQMPLMHNCRPTSTMFAARGLTANPSKPGVHALHPTLLGPMPPMPCIRFTRPRAANLSSATSPTPVSWPTAIQVSSFALWFPLHTVGYDYICWPLLIGIEHDKLSNLCWNHDLHFG